jgi:phosphoribosylformimino-5-aminoimidazole carboxamide ribonucleotide (ProFAR) isomerase
LLRFVFLASCALQCIELSGTHGTVWHMMTVQEVQKTPFARSTQITIAGGITTEADLAALDALGVEGQVVLISLLIYFNFLV